MFENKARLHIESLDVDRCVVLTVTGVLDSESYLVLRDAILKVAVDEPRGLIIEIDRLVVPAPSALVVFTSARWQCSHYPNVPLALVGGNPILRRQVERSGVTRWMRCYEDLAAALGGVCDPDRDEIRLRARTTLSDSPRCSRDSRRFVRATLDAWERTEFVANAQLVVTELVENALRHTDSAPAVRLEHYRGTLTVAVADGDGRRPVLHEAALGPPVGSGLALVSAVCKVWGSLPAADGGKVVWASLRPDVVA